MQTEESQGTFCLREEKLSNSEAKRETIALCKEK